MSHWVLFGVKVLSGILSSQVLPGLLVILEAHRALSLLDHPIREKRKG